MHTGNYFYEISNALGFERSVTFDCNENPSYNDYKNAGKETVGCGNLPASIIIFFSFWILVTLVFINLFIAIILQGY